MTIGVTVVAVPSKLVADLLRGGVPGLFPPSGLVFVSLILHCSGSFEVTKLLLGVGGEHFSMTF